MPQANNLHSLSSKGNISLYVDQLIRQSIQQVDPSSKISLSIRYSIHFQDVCKIHLMIMLNARIFHSILVILSTLLDNVFLSDKTFIPGISLGGCYLKLLYCNLNANTIYLNYLFCCFEDSEG